MLKFELDLCETCFIDYINLLNSVIYKWLQMGKEGVDVHQSVASANAL